MYLGDPRENAIDIEEGVVWESDNRKEQMWHWGAQVLDLCDLPVEEYMKNPIIESINNSAASSSGSSSISEAISAATDAIVSAITTSTDEIINALSGGTSKDIKVPVYYASINSQVEDSEIVPSDFSTIISIVGSETFIDYILGDPTTENWNKYLNGEITETELRELSCNNYFLGIPLEYKDKFNIYENTYS